jgi:hypothetical protein
MAKGIRNGLKQRLQKNSRHWTVFLKQVHHGLLYLRGHGPRKSEMEKGGGSFVENA